MLVILFAFFSIFQSFLSSKEVQDYLPISTFSIVALDSKTGELGVAVQSKFIAVGSVVPYAKAEVGAVATQAWGNVLYGTMGLELLKQGKNPHQIVKMLVEMDPLGDHRQLAIIGSDGNVSNHTGKKCLPWAGAKIGKNYSAQGNLLTGPEVIEAMATTFESSEGKLGERLISSLFAGQQAGGDKRGRQSAALLLVRKNWGYGGANDRFRDIRVDDHPFPIKELERIYKLHCKIFPRPNRPVKNDKTLKY